MCSKIEREMCSKIEREMCSKIEREMSCSVVRLREKCVRLRGKCRVV